MVNDMRDWDVEDPAPGIALDHINSISIKAMALLSRSANNPILCDNYIRVRGLVDIIEGIEYHFNNFVRLYNEKFYCFGMKDNSVDHEVVAYINRCGQFHKFCGSDFYKNFRSISMPTLDRVMMFRHKHAAHRSIDDPRKGDSDHLQVVHAVSLTGIIGRLYSERPDFVNDGTKNHEIPLCKRYILTYQIQTEEAEAINFTPEIDHPILINEIYDLYSNLLLTQS